ARASAAPQRCFPASRWSVSDSLCGGRAPPVAPVPSAATETAEPRATVSSRDGSFDHLVGAHENGGRDRQAEHLRGFDIDHERERRRLLDWNIRRWLAFEYLHHLPRHLPVYLREARAVRGQTALLGQIGRASCRERV